MEPTQREHHRKTETWDVSEALRPHTMMKFMRPTAEDDPRFEALCRDIESNGVVLPILVTAKREIVDPDSVERWRAAKRVGLTEIPVIVVADGEAATIALSTLLNRRHLTLSARAYLAYPLLGLSQTEARFRRLENLKKGQCFPNATEKASGETIEEFAGRFGFSRALYQHAKQVHEIFVRDAEYKADMEPRILAEPIGGEHEDRRPVGLGAVIAGWGGRDSTKDKAKTSHGQLELFTEGFGTFVRRFSYWVSFDERARRQARQEIRSEIAELKPEECGAMAEFMSTVATELRERAKEKRE